MKGRKGFTIIELLVVISILMLLASMALPRLSYLRQKAIVASMISDLRNLVTSQEAFISSHGDYAGGSGRYSRDSRNGRGGAGVHATECGCRPRRELPEQSVRWRGLQRHDHPPGRHQSRDRRVRGIRRQHLVLAECRSDFSCSHRLLLNVALHCRDVPARRNTSMLLPRNESALIALVSRN